MSGVNEVTLVGRVGKDPEVKNIANGSAVVTLSVATSESWKDKQTGEKVEKTEWHRCVFWRQPAEFIGNYVRKGALVYIKGSIETRKWTNNEGVDQYTTEINGSKIDQLVRADAGSAAQASGGGKPATKPAAQPEPAADGFGDDDIPF